VIVTTPERRRFFVQQKDAAYEPHPLGYSFFGGAIEEGETLLEALGRELREELGAAADRLTAAPTRHVLTATVEPAGFRYSLFEVLVDEPTLEALATAPVFEGERGALFGERELSALPFIWGLESVVTAYLAQVLEKR